MVVRDLARDGRQPSRRSFALVGLSFIYLSMDETAGIHEAATRFLDDYSWAPRFSQDNGIWIFVYLALLLALTALLWRDLLAAFGDLRGPFTIIVGRFCLFVLGAVVVEALHYEFVDAGTRRGGPSRSTPWRSSSRCWAGRSCSTAPWSCTRRCWRAHGGRSLPGVPPPRLSPPERIGIGTLHAGRDRSS